MVNSRSQNVCQTSGDGLANIFWHFDKKRKQAYTHTSMCVCYQQHFSCFHFLSKCQKNRQMSKSTGKILRPWMNPDVHFIQKPLCAMVTRGFLMTSWPRRPHSAEKDWNDAHKFQQRIYESGSTNELRSHSHDSHCLVKRHQMGPRASADPNFTSEGFYAPSGATPPPKPILSPHTSKPLVFIPISNLPPALFPLHWLLWGVLRTILVRHGLSVCLSVRVCVCVCVFGAVTVWVAVRLSSDILIVFGPPLPWH